MDRAATLRSMDERIDAHDVDGFAALLADDLVEHGETPFLSSPALPAPGPNDALGEAPSCRGTGAFSPAREELSSMRRRRRLRRRPRETAGRC